MRPQAVADRTLVMRDILDSQLATLDGRKVGRAVDLEAEWRDDGRLVLRRLVLGPEAHAGRISGLVGRVTHRVLGGRFEHAVELSEVEEVGPTLRLARRASEYDLGDADRWIMDHILRWIPGSGRQ